MSKLKLHSVFINDTVTRTMMIDVVAPDGTDERDIRAAAMAAYLGDVPPEIDDNWLSKSMDEDDLTDLPAPDVEGEELLDPPDLDDAFVHEDAEDVESVKGYGFVRPTIFIRREEDGFRLSAEPFDE